MKTKFSLSDVVVWWMKACVLVVTADVYWRSLYERTDENMHEQKFCFDLQYVRETEMGLGGAWGEQKFPDMDQNRSLT